MNLRKAYIPLDRVKRSLACYETIQRTRGAGMSNVLTTLPCEFGGYEVLRLLNRGGMAEVYEARRRSLAGVSPKVALKMILPAKAKDEKYKQLFINEAKVCSTLMHRNIVHIQDFDQVEDLFFLVMEYVEGLTLREVIRTSREHGVPIPKHVIAELGRQMCEGLAYAHQAKTNEGKPLGLIHRDVKPSNIMINGQGMVKVLDFGVSQASILKEHPGAVRGTWGYMAPEQVAGEPLTPRTDLFGAAIVLFEMASLTPMFPKYIKQDPTEMRSALDSDFAAKRVATITDSYPKLASILIRSLQRSPEGRYSTAEQMSRALSETIVDPVMARTDVISFLGRIQELYNSGERTTAKLRELDASDFSGEPMRTMVLAKMEADAALRRGGKERDSSSLGDIDETGEVRIRKKTSPGLKNSLFSLIGLPVGVLLVLVMLFQLARCGQGEPLPPTETTVEQLSPAIPQTKEETTGSGEFIAEEPPPAPPPKKVNKTPKKPSKKVTPPPPVKAEPKAELSPPPEPKAEEPEPEPPPVTVTKQPVIGNAKITISADVSAQIFIDGKKIRAAPLVNYELSTGEHRIHIATTKGQIKSFDIVVKAGQQYLYQWSFTESRWIRKSN